MSKIAIIYHPVRCPSYHEATCFAVVPPRECNKRIGGPAYQITFPDNCPLKDAPLDNKEQPANGSVAGGQGSTNTGSLQLLLDGFKKDYPNLTQKTIHAVNAFVLYVQQQQAGA